MQTDPIGYADQMNLYGYVYNDPMNYTDPYGLSGDPTCGSDATSCHTFEETIPDPKPGIGPDQHYEGEAAQQYVRDAQNAQDRWVGGYSPVAGDYEMSDGQVVSLTVGDNGHLVDANGTDYIFDHNRGAVFTIANGTTESVCPECYLIGGAATAKLTIRAGRLLGPSGEIIGHPAYGGRTISTLRSGRYRFGWGRDGGPTLRLGVGNKHYDFLRLKPPKQ